MENESRSFFQIEPGYLSMLKLNQENLEPPRKSKKWYHRTVKDIMSREGMK